MFCFKGESNLRAEAVLVLELFAIVLLCGCISSPNCVVGSGNVVNETRSVDSFDSIDLRGSGALFLYQGPQQPLKIEAEDNVLKVLTTRVEAGRLIINLNACISTARAFRIYATARTKNAKQYARDAQALLREK